MKAEKNNVGIIIFAMCVLTTISVFSILNWKLAQEPIQLLVKKEITFPKFVESIQSAYLSDDLKGKNNFINLNGLFARLAGRRLCNEVVILNNGMLSAEAPEANVESFAESMVQFNKYLAERESETKFVYVQAPYKESMEGEMFPEGVDAYANENVDELLRILEQENVDTLDLRPFLSQTPKMIEQYFFATDHHWNFEGAFTAYQKIAEYVSALYPDKKMDLSFTDWSQWESHTLEDWFLGSRGKRVGVFFGGVDDVTYYTPKFDTCISFMEPWRTLAAHGEFTKSNIRSYYVKNKDYFGANTYAIYGDRSYPLVNQRNTKAAVDFKLLLIGDSFSLPINAFLGTLFSEVDLLDMRYYTDGSVAEYVEQTNPDLVMVLINPSMVNDRSKYINMGEEELLSKMSNNSKQEERVSYKTIGVTAEEEYETIPLENGKWYTLTFDDVVYEEETPPVVCVSVYNKTTESVIVSTLFDIQYQREKGEFHWSFISPEAEEGEIQLLFYKGIPKRTKEIDAVYQNVTLSSYDWK